MALASQSVRTNDRRRITFSQRRLINPKSIALASVAALGLVLVWWGASWLFGSSNDEPEGLTADETLGAIADGSLSIAPADQVKGPGVPASALRSAESDTKPKNEATPSIRSLVADDRKAGEAAANVPTIEMGGRAARSQDATSRDSATPAANSRVGLQTGTTPPSTPPSAPPVPPGNDSSRDPQGTPGTGDAKRESSPSGSPPATQTKPGQAPPTGPTERTSPESDRALSSAGVTNADLTQALRLQTSDPIQARVLATRALASPQLSAGDRERGYELVNALWRSLFLSSNINPNDAFMRVHTIQPGESLAKVVRSQGLACETLLLKRINGIKDERRIQIGQRLRVPKGAFHAEVIKSEFRLNLFMDAGSGSSDRVMVASFRCGIGESNGTPTGQFKVRPKSKLIDPEWTHPKTGQHFGSHDPMNPIGEHWIGIMGVEAANQNFLGYGIHGTIEPDSIGRDKSLGCVRLLADDVAFVYECLVDPQSTILIK
ncbi:MAG: L,D-transpeptidase family protein [Phycisphaerae bacterium]|jgi:lipoprotein-anchoring transpeptidase ErfK/SrfK|nr:L,D-transpeptidase family protein [Phycisphaerae bacterium]